MLLLYVLFYANFIHTGLRVWGLMELWGLDTTTCRLFLTDAASFPHVLSVSVSCIRLPHCVISLIILLSMSMWSITMLLLLHIWLSFVHKAVIGGLWASVQSDMEFDLCTRWSLEYLWDSVQWVTVPEGPSCCPWALSSSVQLCTVHVSLLMHASHLSR